MEVCDRPTTVEQLADRATELVDATNGICAAAGDPESWEAAPALLSNLEQVLLLLRASWCEIAARAAPTIAERRWAIPGRSDAETGLSRGQEVQLISALHDLAADLTGCARSCRNVRTIVEPLIDRRLHAQKERRVPSAASNGES